MEKHDFIGPKRRGFSQDVLEMSCVACVLCWK